MVMESARLTFLASLAVFAACSPPAPCTHSGASMLEYHLFFGRDIPGRSPLTDAEWADFAARVVTPNLPDGFTAFDAFGQWMNPASHRISAESTKVLIIAVPDTPASEAAIRAIEDAYKAEFHQQSVGTTVAPVCAAF